MSSIRFRAIAAVAIVAATAGVGLSGVMTGRSEVRSELDGAIQQTLPKYEPRFGRTRPVIAVVGDNTATELTDYVVPYGVLVESGVADVVAVAIRPGPIQMSPALRFQPHATLRQFDDRYPQGADYVIVPNIYDGENDLVLREWLREQARRGAVTVGICDGVPTVANAGLLDGRRATGHWKTFDRLRREHPRTRWTRDLRYIADGNVITTTGVSASIPVSMALVEAIGGRARAAALAATMGVGYWGPAHDSDAFRLTPARFLTALRNKLLFWRHETLGLEVAAGIDEVRLALIADTYGRTRRSTVVSIARSHQPFATKRGLAVIPDRVTGTSAPPDRMLSLMENLRPLQALDRALDDIATSYGKGTADFVALTMEYRRSDAVTDAHGPRGNDRARSRSSPRSRLERSAPKSRRSNRRIVRSCTRRRTLLLPTRHAFLRSWNFSIS